MSHLARSASQLLAAALTGLLSSVLFAKEQPGKGQPRGADQAATTTQCGGKRHCKDMSSCAEARFYLQNCGASKLDRDGDGIPCESLCKPNR